MGIPMEIKIGDSIVLTGLKTASYNGEHGEIHGKFLNPADGCPLWELELTGPNFKGETIRVPCHNVKKTKMSRLLAMIERGAKYERIAILEEKVKKREQDIKEQKKKYLQKEAISKPQATQAIPEKQDISEK